MNERKKVGGMIKIYIINNGSSVRRTKQWLMDHNLDYEEINLLTNSICREDFYKILSMTDRGVEDLISKRSLVYKKLSLDFEKLYIEDVIQIMNENSGLFRCPIIVDESHLQIGFNKDDIRQFIPHEARKIRAFIT